MMTFFVAEWIGSAFQFEWRIWQSSRLLLCSSAGETTGESNIIHTSRFLFLCPPWKRGAQLLVCRSVVRSVCKPSVVRSISFDPFTWSIPNLVQRLHPISRWSLFIFRSHVQRSRSNHSWAQCVVHFIYFNPLLTCFGQVLLLQRR